MTIDQIPAHNHEILATNPNGNTSSSANAFRSNTRVLDKDYSNASGETKMTADALEPSKPINFNSSHSNMMPTNEMKWVIAIYPI